MKIILLLIYLVLYINAAPIATVYREQGMQAVEKALNKHLTQKSYWEKELHALDTSFGYFENLDSIITCDKDRSKLYLYKKNKKGKYLLVNTFGAMTGKINGDKQIEGDHKTPLGIYSLTSKITNPDPFYGPLAFVTSYPNLYDKIRGKNGSGIWIHGLPIEGSRDKFTRGCIAIENDNICKLDQNISIENTLLIIDQEHHKKALKDDLATILAKLFEWRYAWIYNDYERYINFYDPTFIRFDNMNYNTFKQYKRRIFNYNDKKSIHFSNIKVTPYPGEDDNIYMITFYEAYHSKRITFNGEKTLIIKQDNETISIISER